GSGARGGAEDGGGNPLEGTAGLRRRSSSPRAGSKGAGWAGCRAPGGATAPREQAVAVARARAQVADRPATGPRGALARRLGQAAAARRRGHGVLARRVLRALPGAAAPPRRPRPGPPAGRESARGGA